VVTCFSIVIPLLWLLLVAWVLFQIRQGEKPALLGPGFRLAERLRPWAMTEVFVVGAFVAYTRLQDLGSKSVSVGIGGAAVAATAFFTFLVDRTLDRRHVWDSIASPELAREGSRPDLSCPACDLLTHLQEGTRCPRCRAVLRRRKRFSVTRTVALTLAGVVLYIPANLLPIMSGRFGVPAQHHRPGSPSCSGSAPAAGPDRPSPACWSRSEAAESPGSFGPSPPVAWPALPDAAYGGRRDGGRTSTSS
jgi:paraquat-inducible protein A